MKHLGIIGLGRMGTFHATQASLRPSVTVTALVDPSIQNCPPTLAPQALRTTDYRDLLDGSVDAVIVAVPTPHHFQIAKEFLAHGVHVLVEKPMTATVSEAEHLFDIAARTNTVLQVGHVERFNHAFITAQTLLAGQQPDLVQATRSGPFHPRVARDSVILDLMIHDVDLLLLLTGSRHITAHVVGRSLVSETIDSACATLSIGERTLATIAAHRASSKGTRILQIETRDQHLMLDLGAQTVTQHHNSVTTTIAPTPGYNALQEQLGAFIAKMPMGAMANQRTHDVAVLTQTIALEKAALAHHATHKYLHALSPSI